jgi:diguanylate cyclase (GGDEF)-like protein
MGFDYSQLVNLPRWNRKLLNSYWIIIGITVLLSVFYNILGYFFDRYETVPIITLNTLRMCLGMFILEAAHYFMKKWHDYLIIFGGTLISISLIYSFPEDTVLLSTLVLPILVSVFYFQRRKVIFSTILSLIGLYMLYLVCLLETALYGPGDLITMTFALLCSAIIGLGIIKSGSELMKHLQSSLESSQDLLVKNVIMDKLIKTDALTDLYNHMSFHEYLVELIKQGERYNLSFQLALLDIDHFKKVNDTYGHRAGDAVLRKTADTLKLLVSPNDFIARYGGEEFAIIFTDMALNEALMNLENIRTCIGAEPLEELNGQPVTISIGVHDFKQGCTKEALFSGADEALYEAKRNGRNQTVVFDETKKATNP